MNRLCSAVAVVAVVVATAATVLVAPPAPVAAQSATGSIALLSQTPFRTPGQPFVVSLRLRTSVATSGLEMAVGTYRRLRSRSEFANAIDGRLPTRTPIDLVRVAVDEVARDDAGDLTIALQPQATQPGVYPVRVELREADGSNVVDGFTTFLTTVPGVVEADPLDVAVILPVHARPAARADGTVRIDDDRADAIADVAQALAVTPSVPVTLAPTPETLEALANSQRAADRDTARLLGQAIAGRQVLASTYVPVDASELLEGNLRGELYAQVTRGARVLTELFDVVPSRAIGLVHEPADERALAALQQHGTRALVAREEVLEPVRPPTNITLTATFEIAARRDTFEAAAADEGLAAHFVRPVPPALAAAHLLADLAVLWLDRPGRSAQRRGAVAMPPRSWMPDGAFVDALLSGLADNPILAAVTLDRFFDEVGASRTRNRPLVRTFVPATGGADLNSGAIRSARRQLEAFASVVEPDNPALAVLDRTLLAAQSIDLRPGARATYLRGVTGRVRQELEAVDMPPRRSITLTAREGELPVTITNGLDYPVTVLLTLESDALDFPRGATRTVELTRQNTTERFEVHARGTGSFPVRVKVTAPEGNLLVAESRFTVRSTAVSGVGIALSVGAALFLVVWWASHLRGRRSSKTTTAAEA